MPDTTDDIRATAESIAADAERLKEVEQATAEIAEDRRRLAELNAQSEELLENIATKGAVQSALVEEATGA
jgi:hypothetical protein